MAHLDLDPLFEFSFQKEALQQAAEDLSYIEMALCTVGEYKNKPITHMPDKNRFRNYQFIKSMPAVEPEPDKPNQCVATVYGKFSKTYRRCQRTITETSTKFCWVHQQKVKLEK